MELPGRWQGVIAEPVAGGQMAHAARLELPDGPAFLKWMPGCAEGAFGVEADGLRALAAAAPGCTPAVREVGPDWLLLDWVETAPTEDRHADAAQRALAELVVRIHSVRSDRGSGWPHTTWLGFLMQRNEWDPQWARFYMRRRVDQQLRVARSKALLDESQLALVSEAARVSAAACPDEPAALAHGDLWSGNWLITPDGRAMVVDPAIHFGHREHDLSYIALFGDVTQTFWQRYGELLPIAPDFFEGRCAGLQMYHLLVHLNHFGAKWRERLLEAAREALG